jgi:DNA-binding transcriptional LysR family regulator
MPAGTGIRTVFDQACAHHGTRPNIVLEASAPAAIIDLAARGLGVAILSESMVDAHQGRLHALAIDDIDAPALLLLVWRAHHSPALNAFLTQARRAFRRASPTDDEAPRTRRRRPGCREG